LAALVVIAEDDIEGEFLARALSLNAHTHTGLRFLMSRMGATAAIKPSTSDEKQRQKLLWCVVFFTRCPHCSHFDAATFTYCLACMTAGFVFKPTCSFLCVTIHVVIMTRAFQDKKSGPSAKPCASQSIKAWLELSHVTEVLVQACFRL
jgi:hypothetical protein